MDSIFMLHFKDALNIYLFYKAYTNCILLNGVNVVLAFTTCCYCKFIDQKKKMWLKEEEKRKEKGINRWKEKERKCEEKRKDD